MGVSLTEVARRCGVSIATVSRALNPDSEHPVGAATRQRVLAAAAELGYRSNAIARALRAGRMQLVGVLVHDIRDPYFADYARGVGDVAKETGFLAMVCSSDRDPEAELAYVRMFRDHRVAGVFFVGSGFEDADYLARMQHEVNQIRDYGGHVITLSPHKDGLPAEVADNVGGAQLAMRHLLELGHRRIAFIGGPQGLTTSVEREHGYVQALAEAGIDFDERLVAAGDFSEGSGGAAIAQLLDAGAEPTAIFSANDAMALGCVQELGRRGLRVPRDMSLVGFGDIPVARWLDPPLTTVSVPMTEIGAAGMRRLLAMLQQDRSDMDNATHVHPTDLIVRATTARPLRAASGVRPAQRSAAER